MGDVVKFPGQPIEGGVLRSDGEIVKECYEHVHIFDAVPGRCQCGESLWTSIAETEAQLTQEVREATGDESLVVTFDTRPVLLSPEKTERKWPEDFRGFGSNVRPKKS